MDIVSPATGAVVHAVEPDTATQITDKVAAARAAQRAWAARPLAERRAVLARFGELLGERADAFAATTTLETGKPVTQARNEIRGLVGARLPFFLDHVERELADEVVLEEAAGASGALTERIRHEALGVVANVSAWNYPYFVGGNVLIPALLTGNAVLYKPSEYATLTGRMLVRTLHEAGVPEAVVACVTGPGAVGARLLEERLDGVFFTGSHATGVRVAQAVAPRMVRLQLELGGKDPAYVADDVDPVKAAAGLADGAFYNAGQSCCAVERIYVHERVAPAFIEAFLAEVRGFVIGDPMDPSTYLGPLTRRELAIAALDAQVADAVGRGARLALGGQRLERPGFYYAPTVLLDVDHGMAVMREESFGPIIGIQVVPDDARALELMADTPYGLTAAVYSADQARAERLLSELSVGSAYWNCCDRVSPRLPWSGRGHSGVGCTLSTYGIEAFLRPKAWHLRGA